MTRGTQNSLICGGFSIVVSTLVWSACGGPIDAKTSEAPDPITDSAEAEPDPPAPWGPFPAGTRRLTAERWHNAVEDLTGLRVEAELPLDYDLHGYVTVGAAGVTVSPYDLELYEAATWDVVQQLVQTPDDRDAVMGCAVRPGPLEADDADDLDADCVRSFVVQTAGRAWRRPVATDEVDALVGLFGSVDERLGPTVAVQATLAAAMLSPHFLYVVEVGASDPEIDDERRLTPHEVATRLSFALTDAPPDAALSAAADDGTILESEVRAEHAERLLATERGRSAMTRFFLQTLDLDRLFTIDKNPAVFPADSPSLRQAMVDELVALWTRVALDEDADLRSILTLNDAYVTPELGAIYGLDVSEPGWVTLPVEQARGGLLGRAGFAALEATATRTSPTERGKFVRTRLLCENVPPPPEGVVASLDGAEIGGDDTLRQVLEQHMNDPACLPCHEKMDPLGFGMEHLDGLGQWRAVDAGQPVDASGDLDGVRFSDARGLGLAVATDPRFGACLARQLQRRALGALEGERQEPEVASLAQDFAASGHRLSALVASLAASEAFVRVAPPIREVECEETGATRACESACGEGVETCLGGMWQGCTAPSAPHEQCDGEDADCDGVVDAVELSCSGDGWAVCDAGEWAECSGATEASAETCNGLDDDLDGAVDEDLLVDTPVVSFTDITTAHEGCDVAGDTISGPCGAAVHRTCAALDCGFSTGFGPLVVDHDDDRAALACFGPEQAVPMSTTFTVLKGHHPYCSESEPMSADCNASINRFCAAAGLTTGFGPLEHSGDGVLVACTPTAVVHRVPYDDLSALNGNCSWFANRFEPECREAMHRWCEGEGYATGYGPLENWEGDAWVACVPHAAEETP